jgi:uncharacterized protein with HEPN domain
MNLEQQRLADYLAHILKAIERIDSHVADLDEISFLNNILIQDAVIRNFEIIGEASHNIEKRYPEFVRVHPELPLTSAYQMRNAIAHGYFKVDFELIWKTINNDLPDFYRRVKNLAELKKDNQNQLFYKNGE